jgi:hypothetical protein
MAPLLPVPRFRPSPAAGLAAVPVPQEGSQAEVLPAAQASDALDLRTGKTLLLAGGAVSAIGTVLLMTVNPSKSKATITTKKIAYFGLLAGAALTVWGLMDERARAGVVMAINKLRGG